MKIAVSTYSYAGYKASSMYEILDKIAATGFEGVEFVEFDVAEGDSDILATAKKYGDYARSKGLEVVNYAVGGSFLQVSHKALDDEVERLCKQVDIAEALGCKKMRHDVAYSFPEDYVGIRTFNASLPLLFEGCRKVTQYAKTKGIITTTENHGYFCQDSHRIVRLAEAVNDENFGTTCDIGNFSCVDEDSEKATANVLPLIKHVHVKDMFIKDGSLPKPGDGWFSSRGGNYIRCTILGHGDIPIVKCLRQIKNSGYKGYLSIEFEGMEESLQAIDISYRNLKYYLSII